MISKYNFLFILIIIVYTSIVLIRIPIAHNLVYPFHLIKISAIEKYVALDMFAVLTGTRRLVSDIAWIQLLQYYGSPEKPLEKEEEYNVSIDMTKYIFGIKIKDRCDDKTNIHGHYQAKIEGGIYPDLFKYCSRVVNLDPFYYYVYLYGAGALAWNLQRPDEAVELLKKGVNAMEKYKSNITKDVHQPFWQFHLYLSAIAYRKAGEYNKMAQLLETAVNQPECPNMVKVILANLYQKENKIAGSLRIWIQIYESNDLMYNDKAKEKIIELKNILKQN